MVGAGGKKKCVRHQAPQCRAGLAIHAVLKPEVKLVSIQGVAGTGKTLIALAAALEQKKSSNKSTWQGPIVPLSNKDIGFLPGDIKSKINPIWNPCGTN